MKLLALAPTFSFSFFDIDHIDSEKIEQAVDMDFHSASTVQLNSVIITNFNSADFKVDNCFLKLAQKSLEKNKYSQYSTFLKFFPVAFRSVDIKHPFHFFW